MTVNECMIIQNHRKMKGRCKCLKRGGLLKCLGVPEKERKEVFVNF